MAETTADEGLISTGELARRLGRSQSGVRKLAQRGLIPAATVIVGSGRKVWNLADLPSIEAAVRERGGRKQRRRLVRVADLEAVKLPRPIAGEGVAA